MITLQTNDPACHKEWCASLPKSKAQKYLGPCYCNCGVEDSTRNSTFKWKLLEEIHAICLFPADADPDDMSFNRVKPIFEIPYNSEVGVAFAKFVWNAMEVAQ